MVRGWLGDCSLRSIDLRHFGFVPHSRLFTTQAAYAQKKADTILLLQDQGFGHHFELSGTNKLKEATVGFASQLTTREIDFGNWTAVVVDRKKVPTVLFAFRESSDAVRAKLVLELA